MKTQNATIRLIETFLRDVKEIKASEIQAAIICQEVHEATQDALHYLEFGDTTRIQRQKVATELIKHRKRRRVAKNTAYANLPIRAWVEENKKALHGLEQALGEARKRESAAGRRTYTPRTSFFIDHEIGEK